MTIRGPERIYWAGEQLDEISGGYLPKMKTDISIRWPQRYLIIDTKYYREALTRNFDKEAINSANLYQIFSYVRNLAKRSPEYGMLLYPTVETDLCLQYTLHNHRITVSTIDLAQDWREIHRRLLSLASEPEAVFAQA